MTTIFESKVLIEKDFLNMALLNDLRQNVENGNEVHILAASNDLLVPMWSLTGEDFPEKVLLEVEVISSWEDEMPGVINIDRAACSTDSGTLSDYVCDPALTYKQETDYNRNESISPSIQNVIEPVVNYQITQDEQMDDEEDDDAYDNITSVTVEAVKSSRIPLTVTSQDDNDSGTESFDSKYSTSSLKLDMLGNEMNIKNPKLDRKRPGRKKGQVSKVYHLWEFIRDILNDPKHSGKIIKWEDEEEGIFRVVQSEVAAAMWGAKKNNRTKMTYEKMSRSIRYSRKEGYFDDLPKDKGYPKKLCFKFGQRAHGWNSKKCLIVHELPTIANDQ